MAKAMSRHPSLAAAGPKTQQAQYRMSPVTFLASEGVAEPDGKVDAGSPELRDRLWDLDPVTSTRCLRFRPAGFSLPGLFLLGVSVQRVEFRSFWGSLFVFQGKMGGKKSQAEFPS